METRTQCFAERVPLVEKARAAHIETNGNARGAGIAKLVVEALFGRRE